MPVPLPSLLPPHYCMSTAQWGPLPWGVHNWPWCSQGGTSGHLKASVNICQGTSLLLISLSDPRPTNSQVGSIPAAPWMAHGWMPFWKSSTLWRGNWRASMVALTRRQSVVRYQSDSQVSAFQHHLFRCAARHFLGCPEISTCTLALRKWDETFQVGRAVYEHTWEAGGLILELRGNSAS